MGLLTNQQKKEFARGLYLSDVSITQKEIAKRVSVTEATVSKWINTEKWEDLRTNLVMTRDEQLNRLYKQLSELNGLISLRDDNMRYPTKDEANIIRTLTGAINKLEIEMSVSDKLEVCKQLLEFVRSTESYDKVKEIALLVDQFIKSSIK